MGKITVNEYDGDYNLILSYHLYGVILSVLFARLSSQTKPALI